MSAMTLSPQQKDVVLRTMAGMLLEELREEMGGAFTGLYVIPLAVAEKLTGLSRNTLRSVVPIVELTDGKHGVRLTVLKDYIDRKTVAPALDPARIRRKA